MTVKQDPSTSFPALLHRMLSDIDELAKTDSDMKKLQAVVSWQDHGRAFKVHDKKKFVSIVMPTWFVRIKYSSWIRQLSLFGFHKIHEEGPDKGGELSFTQRRILFLSFQSSLCLIYRLVNCIVHFEPRSNVP